MKRILESIWAESEVWPEYTDLLRQALAPHPEKKDPQDSAPTRWLKLPGLCCQAAGGDPRWGDDLTAAWVLFQVAAHLLDSVEDQDPPDAWWAERGAGMALSAASGLYFTACLALHRLHASRAAGPAAEAIAADFYRCFLKMSAGQHLDLLRPEPSLEEYWAIAAAKSGAFFALGCRCGARLVTSDPARVESYGRFGHHFGLLVQIFDDLDELRSLKEASEPGNSAGLLRSLAVVYALGVLPGPLKTRLRDSLRALPGAPQAAGEAWQILAGSGAKLYLLTEIERQRTSAREALNRAAPLPGPQEILASMLEELVAAPAPP